VMMYIGMHRDYYKSSFTQADSKVSIFEIKLFHEYSTNFPRIFRHKPSL